MEEQPKPSWERLLQCDCGALHGLASITERWWVMRRGWLRVFTGQPCTADAPLLIPSLGQANGSTPKATPGLHKPRSPPRPPLAHRREALPDSQYIASARPSLPAPCDAAAQAPKVTREERHVFPNPCSAIAANMPVGKPILACHP